MVNRRQSLIALVSLLAFAGCGPELDDHSSLVEQPRILAIRSEPAEAKVGTSITYTALVGLPEGISDAPPMEWAFCNERKPLAELGPVSIRCLEPTGEKIVPIGEGPTAVGTLPRDACRNFGPAAPPAVGDEPAGRPVDPDASGGYYQPVRLELDRSQLSLGSTRVACGVAGATAAQLGEFNRRYVSNQNPVIDRLSVVRGGDELTLAPGLEPSPTNVVGTGERLTLRATWESCDEAPCTGSEPYVVFEAEGRRVVDRRETIRISWYATAGSFAQSGTGRDGGDPLPFTDNEWIAPIQPGPVRLWAVILDDRGGTGWEEYLLLVE